MPETVTDRTSQEGQALDQLISLLEENDQADLIDRIDLPKTLEMVEKQSENPKTKNSTLRKKSAFCPARSTNSNAAAFLNLVNRELDKLKIQTKNPTNLSANEAPALKQLSDNSSITIKASDKGGNVVILDNEKYIDMCNQILKNPNWYRRMPGNIVEKFNREFYDLIDNAFSNNMINKQLWNFVRNDFLRVPTFFTLPKVHKNEKKFPLDPLKLEWGAISENASKLIDECLKPFVTVLPSYVKDTSHFLQIIDNLSRNT